MDQEILDKKIKAHKEWLDSNGSKGERLCLRGADLRGAALRNSNLRKADLRGAALDYSNWTLWCGSFDVKVDKQIAAQLAYHFCRLDCDDPEFIEARNAIIGFANQFHRAKECGELLAIETEGKWLEKENENLSRKGKEIMGGIDASEAIEKQIPKKPIEKHYEDEGESPYVKYACPNDCGIQLWPKTSKNLAHEHVYCPKCGQKIDWEGIGNERSGD